MSRNGLACLALMEAVLVSLIGGICGIFLGLLIIVPFSGLIEHALGLPFLRPGWPAMTVLCAASLAAVCIAGPAAAMFSARKLSRADIGTIMREGA